MCARTTRTNRELYQFFTHRRVVGLACPPSCSRPPRLRSDLLPQPPLPQPGHQGANYGRERWGNPFLRVPMAAVALNPHGKGF